MKRVSFFITEKQYLALQMLAVREDTTVSRLFRRAISDLLKGAGIDEEEFMSSQGLMEPLLDDAEAG